MKLLNALGSTDLQPDEISVVCLTLSMFKFKTFNPSNPGNKVSTSPSCCSCSSTNQVSGVELILLERLTIFFVLTGFTGCDTDTVAYERSNDDDQNLTKKRLVIKTLGRGLTFFINRTTNTS